jgi:sugar/nucleoside kinase (ribokinase family)
MENIINELQTFLRQKPPQINVVVMPDFFLDRLISLNCDRNSFCRIVADITKRKGGSIDGIQQTDLRGGNAINTASALAALDITVTPIICTTKRGLEKLRYYMQRGSVDLSHVKILERASLTTALELESETGKVNVMLRDLGSLADFSTANLTNNDYELLDSADYVCLFNWAGLKKHGTELAQEIFQRVKRGKGKTYFDTADPTPNREKIPDLMEIVLKTELLDIVSLNENEAVTYASLISGDFSEESIGGKRSDKLALEASKLLAGQLPARIDLHTTGFSGTFKKKSEVVVPTFKVNALRATGAGDSWNAGNILGDSYNLSTESRLTLANAVAACYISSPSGSHPTREQLIRFLEKN